MPRLSILLRLFFRQINCTVFRKVYVLFFFSGFPALIYQLIWQRDLFRIFGVNIESVTIIVTAFMLGLGLGSLAGGIHSRYRRVHPLLLLAVLEFLTGAFGAVSLRIFDQADSFVLTLPLAAKAIIALGLVFVPTLLMGASLPILVAYFARNSDNVGNAVGSLYYVNTLGAGCACFFSALLFFPILGMQGSVILAALINLLVGAGALYVYLFGGGEMAQRNGTVPGEGNAPIVIGFAHILLLAFLTGFVSLSHEIYFFRVMSYASGSNPMIFAFVLGIFLIGLASGARKAGEWCSRNKSDLLMRKVLNSVVAANGISVLFLPVLNGLSPIGSVIACGAALFLIYLFAKFWSVLLPSLAHLGITADNRTGLQVSLLYLANILGSAAGSLVTGFVLMEQWGIVQINIFLVVLGLSSALFFAYYSPVSSAGRKIPVIAVTIGVITPVVLPMATSTLFENLLWANPGITRPLSKVIENRSGIIVVDHDGMVLGDGMYDGRFNTDLLHHDTNMIFRPFALSLFHPAPRDVLMIGLSSGSWANVIASNPDVASLTVVEINPGYIQLISEREETKSILSNPKVHIIIDDGRRWLRLHPERKFDAIVANTTFHFRSGATHLLSAEFLELGKRHLNPGGILYYNTTGSTRVMRTACTVFPYGMLFSNHMVVSMSPLQPNYDHWRQVLESYTIDGVPVVNMADPDDKYRLDQFISAVQANKDEQFSKSREKILMLTQGQDLVTDDNMGSEWRLPFIKYRSEGLKER